MSSKNPVPLHYSVGPQRLLDIVELPKSPASSVPALSIQVRREDGSPLLPPVTVVDPYRPIDVAHAVAQAMAQLPDLAYGINHQPYLWTGSRWESADHWAHGVSLAMHRIIGTARHTGRASNCFYNALSDAWFDQRRKHQLELKPFGDCKGVPVEDGVVNVRSDGTLDVVKHDRVHGNLHVLPVQSQAVFDAWMDLQNGLTDDSLLMRFMRSSLDEDQMLVLRRWFGLHLVVHRIGNPERLLFMHGPGGNGKGIVLRLLRALVTDDAVAPLRLHDLRTPANLEKLVGALSMIGAEGTAVTDRELLKGIVSWEPVTVNPKYRDPFVLHPQCLVTQASNPDPTFDDNSDSMVRRVIALHMTHQPSPAQRVIGLADRIKAEEYALLVAFALQGAGEVLEAGDIVVPASVAQHSERVVRPVRPVDRFVDMLEFGPYEIAADELFAGHRLMCEKQKLPLTPKRQFFDELRERLDRASKEVVLRSKVTGVDLSKHFNDRGEVFLIAPQLAGAQSCDVWFGLRIAEGNFGPAIGHPLKEGRRGLPEFA